MAKPTSDSPSNTSVKKIVEKLQNKAPETNENSNSNSKQENKTPLISPRTSVKDMTAVLKNQLVFRTPEEGATRLPISRSSSMSSVNSSLDISIPSSTSTESISSIGSQGDVFTSTSLKTSNSENDATRRKKLSNRNTQRFDSLPHDGGNSRLRSFSSVDNNDKAPIFPQHGTETTLAVRPIHNLCTNLIKIINAIFDGLRQYDLKLNKNGLAINLIQSQLYKLKKTIEKNAGDPAEKETPTVNSITLHIDTLKNAIKKVFELYIDNPKDDFFKEQAMALKAQLSAHYNSLLSILFEVNLSETMASRQSANIKSLQSTISDACSLIKHAIKVLPKITEHVEQFDASESPNKKLVSTTKQTLTGYFSVETKEEEAVASFCFAAATKEFFTKDKHYNKVFEAFIKALKEVILPALQKTKSKETQKLVTLLTHGLIAPLQRIVDLRLFNTLHETYDNEICELPNLFKLLDSLQKTTGKNKKLVLDIYLNNFYIIAAVHPFVLRMLNSPDILKLLNDKGMKERMLDVLKKEGIANPGNLLNGTQNPLESLLIAPVQRPAQSKLTLNEIFKYFPERNENRKYVENFLTMLNERSLIAYKDTAFFPNLKLQEWLNENGNVQVIDVLAETKVYNKEEFFKEFMDPFITNPSLFDSFEELNIFESFNNFCKQKINRLLRQQHPELYSKEIATNPNQRKTLQI